MTKPMRDDQKSVVYFFFIFMCQIHNLHICTHNRTQYKQLHTKFIHLLYKVGVGTSQDGMRISSTKRMIGEKP